MKEKVTQEEYIMLKLMETLCKRNKISKKTFSRILNDYRGKIDYSNFSCYTESKMRQFALA